MFAEARILEVDLSALTCTERRLPAETYRLYPGGSALALYLMFQHTPAGADPLGPENALVFAASPLASLPVAGQSRMTVAARSPLTGAVGDSQSGGFFPAALRANGWDALVFKGQAPHPVYLYLREDAYELRPARHIWGKVTGDAEALLRQELGTDALEIAQIGPAGEQQVRYAAVITMCNRANGRSGMGAVMGSKLLKAVVVPKKARGLKPADQKEFMTLNTRVAEKVAASPFMEGLHKYGTAGELTDHAEVGFLPTRNLSTGVFAEAEAIGGKTMAATILKERDTCHGCAVHCKRVVEVAGELDPLYGGPEYETCATFGSYCGVGDLTAVSKANMLCNMYGMDTISCGATIAFAMECVEQGILSAADTDGLDLRFGNAEAMLAMVEKIARRQGLGRLLGEGSALAARAIGPAAAPLVMAVKGLEVPAHMPQYKASLSVIYAANPFGADHQSSEHDTSLSMPADHWLRQRLDLLGPFPTQMPGDLDADKVRFAFSTQCFYSLLDTVGLCQFVWGPTWQLYGPEDLIRLLRAGIGWETTLGELLKIGERRLNLMRAFNAREGFTRAEDKLPACFFQGLPEGPAAGARVDPDAFARAMELYYHYAGWDPVSGNPRPGKLAELNLGWLAAGQAG